MQQCRLWIVILAAVVLLNGCGKQENSETVENAEPERMAALHCLPNNIFQAVDPENENLAELLQENASGVIVGIRSGELYGSGVIFQMTEEEMVIVTASHVIASHVTLAHGISLQTDSAQMSFNQTVTEGDALQVTLIDGTVLEDNGENWHISISKEYDLGFLRIPADEIPSQVYESCRYAATDKKAFDSLAADDRILIMGSADGIAANAYEGRLVEPWIYLEDYGQYMMLAEGYARPGMSGGGIFDSQGYFIGILSGVNEQGILAVLPLSIIQSEYAEQKG